MSPSANTLEIENGLLVCAQEPSLRDGESGRWNTSPGGEREQEQQISHLITLG